MQNSNEFPPTTIGNEADEFGAPTNKAPVCAAIYITGSSGISIEWILFHREP